MVSQAHVVAAMAYRIRGALSAVHDLCDSGKQRALMNLPPHPVNEKVAGWWHVGLGIAYGFVLWYHFSAAMNHFLAHKKGKS